MRIVRWVAGAALGALVAAVGCAQSEDAPPSEATTASTRQGIQASLGIVDATNKYPWAVGVCIGTPRSTGQGPTNAGCQYFCSGTLVLPNMVVTARHCVSETLNKNPDETIDCSKATFGPAIAPTSNFSITTKSTLLQFGVPGWHNVKQILVPQASKMCGNDLAVLVLNDVIASTEASPVIPGIQYPIGDARYGIDYLAIGYGASSSTTNDPGTRRYTSSTLRLGCVPDDPNFLCPEPLPADKLDAKEFSGGDGVCGGDSGSGAYEKRTFDKGVPVSWGVLSRGGEDKKTGACLNSYYTRLDSWRDFIVEAADKASNQWTLYPKPSPDWTVYVPPAAKDAGAPPPPPPTTKPTAGLGEACSADADCSSKVCAGAPDGSQVCTKACDDAAGDVCPDGFVCNEAQCFPAELVPTEAAPATATTTTSSCAASPAGGSRGVPVSTALGALLGLAAVLGRRRR